MKTQSVGGFFVGCGGLDFGFVNAGFKIKWANEKEESFANSYKSLTGHSCLVGDFWEVFGQMPEVDVVIGGPPCQSFSLVGKRVQDDPRGALVGGFLEMIASKRPRAFLMENVAGLSASRVDGIRLPEHLANQFKRMGYDVLVERVDASEYFVPQRRKRLIIIGVLNPTMELKIVTQKQFALHIKKRTGVSLELGKTSTRAALSDLPPPSVSKGTLMEYQSSPNSPYSELMRRGSGNQVSHQTMPTMSKLDREFVEHIPQGGNYMNIPDEICTPRIMKFKRTGGRTTCYGRLSEDLPAYTINTYFNRPNVGANYHYSENRLITVREAMRLQSFPDTFSPDFKSQRELHIQIGNAVPPLLAEALAISMIGSIGG